MKITEFKSAAKYKKSGDKSAIFSPKPPLKRKEHSAIAHRVHHCRAPPSLVLRTVGATLCGLVDKARSDNAVAQRAPLCHSATRNPYRGLKKIKYSIGFILRCG